MDSTRRTFVFLVLASTGCGGMTAAPTPPPADPPASTGSQFDAATAGEIRGRVTWKGDAPRLDPVMAAIPEGQQIYHWTEKPAPFAPVVDAKSGGLGGAVVYLKSVDLSRSRPWDLPPVTVLMRDHQIRVKQGDGPPREVGVVRRGDAITMLSEDVTHHALRARGAAYFTLPFPDAGKPVSRTLDRAGLVELTSGTGFIWTGADLFVDDHPYYTLTEPDGRFTLPRVPPGRYELVCRVHNWQIVEKERDPETGLVFRVRFAPALEKREMVALGPKENLERTFVVQTSEFPTGR